MNKFVVNDTRVNKFVTDASGLGSAPVHSSIGVEREGEIVAGVIYCDPTPSSVCIHVAAKPGVNWISRAFLKLVFGYCFDGLGVKRVTGFVPESNARARKLDEHLGFKHEATLSDIYPDGGLMVFRMMREDCRWI